MPDIEYPYLPEGRTLKYVPADHPFMQAASGAREERAGDPSYPVGAALVRDGEVVLVAGNGYDQGRQVHVCPRIVLDAPSGEGYELCDLHDAPGHAESQLMRRAKEEGIETEGADVYLFGHWWACEPCWNKMIEAGVRDVHVVDDAHERFHRDVVYPAMLVPSVQSAYFAYSITNVPEEEKEALFGTLDAMAVVCEEADVRAYRPHLVSSPAVLPDATPADIYALGIKNVREHDVVIAEITRPSLGTGGEIVEAVHSETPVVLFSKKGSKVSRFALGNPAVVYHAEYETSEEAARYLRNILKQL